MPNFLNRNKILFSFRGDLWNHWWRGCSKQSWSFCVRGCWRLATRKLLTGEEMDSPLLRLICLPGQWGIEPLKDLSALVGWGNSPLVRLVFLSEQGVIESLMKMRSLLGQMALPWVDLYVERRGHPQVDPSLFPLQIPDSEWMPVFIFKERTVNVIPVDGALAGSETESCWVLVWNHTRRNLSEKRVILWSRKREFYLNKDFLDGSSPLGSWRCDQRQALPLVSSNTGQNWVCCSISSHQLSQGWWSKSQCWDWAYCIVSNLPG
jgi:hypothetical protein